MDRTLEILESVRLKPTAEVNAKLADFGSSALTQTLSLRELLKRPELNLKRLALLAALAEEPAEIGETEGMAADEIELHVKYEGYIQRQEEQVERFKRLERIALPEDFVYQGLPGLSNEVVEKLSSIQPRSLGQAARISGITPAAIAVLQVQLKRLGRL